MIAETSRMDGAKRRLSQLGKNAATTVISTALVISSAVAAPQSNAQEAYAPESREWGDSVPLPPGADIVVNPPLKASEYSCTPEVGRSIALVFDLSTSIGVDGLQQTKAAGKAVVETLDGTRNKVGIYNFGTVAPAADAVDAQSDALSMEDPSSKDTLNGAIDRMTVGHRVATNWDRGLAQLQGKNYDVVYFVTDGLPTVYADAAAEARKRENGAKYDWYGNLRSYPRGALNNPGYSHLDSNGRAIKDYAAALADVQRAVASANNLKTEGTRIVPLAVGDAVNDGNAARAYLNYISGDGDWVPVTHFSELAEDLSKQATGDCQGELVINKQLTNSKGAIVDGELADFQFEAVATANGISVLNGGNATTNAGGSATLRYLVTDKRIPTTLSITETNGDLKDVKCTAQSGGQVPSDVIKREGNTFSVPTGVGEKVTCTVINRAPCPVCNPVTETVTTTKTLPPSTVTTTETPEPVTETVTETPEPVTTTEAPEPVTETVTETPEPVTTTETPEPVTETVTETPEAVTTTETPEPVTTTETPEPVTETVTETPEAVTTTETPEPVTTTETPEPVTETVTETPEPVTTTETPEPVTETVTETPEPVTTTEAPEPVTETVTETPEPVTTTETPEPVTETVTETPEPVTTTETPEPVTETVTETPEPVTTTEAPEPVTETVTETPEPVTTTETPEPVTETVTETPEPVTETVTETPEAVTTTEIPEPVTTTETPEPVTETVTETPEAVTTTEILEPVTTTETPEPVTTTETPEPVTTTETPEPVTTTETPTTVTVTAKTKPGSSLGGGSSEGDIDERCLPATLALAVPLLALVPMQLMQGMSLPLVDDIAGQINEQIASANRQVQDGLGIYDERTAQAIENFNAQIRQHQTDNAAAFQAAGTVAVIAALAGYFAYFCVPRSDEAKSSLLDSSSRSA